MLPIRLIRRTGEEFSVFSPDEEDSLRFEIVSYEWGPRVPGYRCDIPDVTWDVITAQARIDDIKQLMHAAKVDYMWADCVCIKQLDGLEKSQELGNMCKYYQQASRCHVLIRLDHPWCPKDIISNLKLVDHVITSINSASISSKSPALSGDVMAKLADWAEEEWSFDSLDKSTVESTAIDVGLLNCYATCIQRITSLFEASYFSRVWTFQEILLGKDISMWGVTSDSSRVAPLGIGKFQDWVNLATDAKDKAMKLWEWVATARKVNTDAVDAILHAISKNLDSLSKLLTRVGGMESARTDIILGRSRWWERNHEGVGNIFSAVSIRSRQCERRQDVVCGLLGVSSGLITAEKIAEWTEDENNIDMNKISFQFFQQLSEQTGRAWTRLVLNGKSREGLDPGWDWIPVVPANGKPRTDCFAGVADLGALVKRGSKALAVGDATTVPWGPPSEYAKITIRRDMNSRLQDTRRQDREEDAIPAIP